MPFDEPEPFDTAEAAYVWTGLGSPGCLLAAVKGHARKFSSGLKIVQDPHWVGGLAFDVTGGRAARGAARTTPYTVRETFHGTFHKEIVVYGSNKREVVQSRSSRSRPRKSSIRRRAPLGRGDGGSAVCNRNAPASGRPCGRRPNIASLEGQPSAPRAAFWLVRANSEKRREDQPPSAARRDRAVSIALTRTASSSSRNGLRMISVPSAILMVSSARPHSR